MTTNTYIHYRYAIAFLLLILIQTVAFAYYEVPALVERVSFALTMASLVLALVAIIYSFVVTSRQDAQFNQIVRTNASVTAASQEIQRVASAINNQIRDIPSRLESLDSKLGTLTVPPPANAAADSGAEGSLPEYSARQFQRYLVNLRYGAMASLYLFMRSHRTGKVISSESIGSMGRFSEFKVVIGILSGMEGSGILSFRMHKGELIPITCAPVVVETLKMELDRILGVLGSEGLILRRLLESVDSVFETNAPHEDDQICAPGESEGV